jgi:tetratricopeptide (TPR) repeat protein
VTSEDLDRLAADLEGGRADTHTARKLAASVPAEEPWGRDIARFTAEAANAYTSGRTRRAWALATIVNEVADSWSSRGSRPWGAQRRQKDGALDLKARALAVLGFVEADEGRPESAVELRKACEVAVGKLADGTAARLDIGMLTAERSIRLGRPDEAVHLFEQLLQMPSLSQSQRAAAQAVLAGALRAAGRPEDAIAALESTAGSFIAAGRPAAALAADLERGIHLTQSGDTAGAQALLAHVAEGAAATGNALVEADARLRLGMIAAEAGRHAESAEEFRLGAGAARRSGDDAKVVIALRNAADELRMQGDLDAAERLLNEALTIKSSPALELDLAKAMVMFAVLRHQQGHPHDASRLLDEAEATFQRRFRELEAGSSPRLRDHLESQLRQLAAVRGQIA